MTTRWEKAGIIIAVIGIPISLTANWISHSQLQSSINNFKSTQVQQKKNAANSAVTTYLNSSTLAQAKFLINERTKNGTDYSKVPEDYELYNAVLAILNNLNATMTNVKHGLYSEEIICDHFRDVVNKQVEVHIKGQRSYGVTVTNPEPFSDSDFPDLIATYNAWNKQGCGSYKAEI